VRCHLIRGKENRYSLQFAPLSPVHQVVTMPLH
jgi:hypothetical protein